jgi:hypothetical protein
MRRKVSTIMEESLFRRAKLEAARQGRPLAAIIEEALQRYFDSPPSQTPAYRSVDETWDALSPVSPELIRYVMEEEEDEYGES